MKACLYTRLPDRILFDRVGFYKNDIRIFSELGFDFVYTNRLSEVPWDCDLYISWFPYWGALLHSIPAIRHRAHITIGNVDAAMPVNLRSRGWKSKLLLSLEKWTVRHATISLPTSRFEEKVFIRMNARRVRMVYHGIDTDKYCPPDNQALRHPDWVLTVTHLNQQNYLRKCISSIIESAPLIMRDHPQTRFVVCGRQDPQVMECINCRIKRVGAERHFVFVGNIDEDEKLRYLQKSAVYLQPTLYEGFGLAIAEAMSCGLPVVTSQVGSVPEVVGDAGLFAPGHSPFELARHVSQLLSDPAMREHLGRIGRERIVSQFAYPMRRSKIADVVEQVMGDVLTSDIRKNITLFKSESS